jgi:hypothetical protein
MSTSVQIQGWTSPPPAKVVEALTGRVLHVIVGGMLGPGPTPLSNFWRFARVLEVKRANVDSTPTGCPRCQDEARHLILVEWEAGYQCPEANVLCENCIDGVVTEGAQQIAFGSTQHPPRAYDVTISVNLNDEGQSDA